MRITLGRGRVVSPKGLLPGKSEAATPPPSCIDFLIKSFGTFGYISGQGLQVSNHITNIPITLLVEKHITNGGLLPPCLPELIISARIRKAEERWMGVNSEKYEHIFERDIFKQRRMALY